MGSIVETIDCPFCRSENGAIVDYNYKTGEEFIHCPHCGYHRRFYITNINQKPDLVDDAATMSDEQWLPEYEIFECSEPYGAFEVQYKEGYNEIGSFTEPENEEEFLLQVEDLIDEIRVAKISKFVDDKIVVIDVVKADDEK